MNGSIDSSKFMKRIAVYTTGRISEESDSKKCRIKYGIKQFQIFMSLDRDILVVGEGLRPTDVGLSIEELPGGSHIYNALNRSLKNRIKFNKMYITESKKPLLEAPS